MTLRAPLSVRINDGSKDRLVGHLTRGLKFTKTAPGGFHSLEATVDIDPYLFTDLGPADKVYVYGPDGRTLWEGLLENPGSMDGTSGRSLELSAMGTLVLAEDRSQNLVYVDRELTKWEQVRASSTATSANANSSDDPTAVSGGDPTQGLLCQFNPGQPVAFNAVSQIGYSALVDAGMELGALAFTIKDGKTDAGYRTELVVSSGTGTAVATTFGSGISTAIRGPFLRYVAVGGSSFAAGNNRVALQLRRSGAATNVADDVTWSFFYDVSVCGRRVDVTGALISGIAMTGANYVRADWVATDLVGRMLAGIVDPAAVSIDATAWQIDQLAYHDGATMAQVLDDLALWEPDYLWEILASTGSGYGFRYRAWPTTARYEVSTRDGYDAPGGEADLCNRVAVFWTDAKGRPRQTVVTATSATYPALSALEQQGRIKDAEPVTLPAGFGSESNAQRIGEQVLREKASLSKAATVTLRKPIRDLLRGGMAAQYEIEPGYLVHVRETGDLLRLTEVEYDDESGEATLTLGTPVLTIEQRIARLSKVRPRKAA